MKKGDTMSKKKEKGEKMNKCKRDEIEALNFNLNVLTEKSKSGLSIAVVFKILCQHRVIPKIIS